MTRSRAFDRTCQDEQNVSVFQFCPKICEGRYMRQVKHTKLVNWSKLSSFPTSMRESSVNTTTFSTQLSESHDVSSRYARLLWKDKVPRQGRLQREAALTLDVVTEIRHGGRYEEGHDRTSEGMSFLCFWCFVACVGEVENVWKDRPTSQGCEGVARRYFCCLIVDSLSSRLHQDTRRGST